MTTETQFPGLVKAEARLRACRRAIRLIATQAHSSVRDVDIVVMAIYCDPQFAILFEGQDEERRRETLKGLEEAGLGVSLSEAAL